MPRRKSRSRNLSTLDWADRVYLSADESLDGTNILLASVTAGGVLPLAPGGTYVRNVPVTMPGKVPDCDYFIVKQGNSDAAQPERSQEHNTAVLPIVLATLPDLRLASQLVVVPASAVFGRPVSVQWTVKSVGVMAAIRI